MKIISTILITLMVVTGVIDNIATVNRLKKEAEQAYKEGDYATAISHYRTLTDSLKVQDDGVRLNLAHALLQAGDTIAARRNYSSLVRSEQPDVKSVAYQQMGIVASAQQQYEESLASFKESLKANPANEEARYNYELVKQLLEQQQEQQQQDQQNQDQQDQEQQQEQQDQDQQNQQQQQNQQGEDQQQQQQQQQDGEQSEEQEGQPQQQEGKDGEQKPEDAQEQNTQDGQQQEDGQKNDEEQSASSLSERLKEMNISEEKARMILEAMRNNEMQYIQQNRRRPEKPRDRSKPDW